MAPNRRAKTQAGHAPAVKQRTRNGAAGRALPGLPEWEAMKARPRNLSHGEAVREVALLSSQCRQRRYPMASVQVELNQVLRAVQAKKVPFVLTGTHGISTWTGRVRATKDIDIVVKVGRNHRRAVNALKALYPQLEVHTFAGVTGFFIPSEQQSLIDVTDPHRADIEETLESASWVEEGSHRYRIPTLEAALANKYGAMLTLSRDPGKRLVGRSDFYYMVRHSMEEGRQPIDLDKLAALGEKVWPGVGGAEILRLVEQAKAGKTPAPALPEETQ
jgi:hypothetical protein